MADGSQSKAAKRLKWRVTIWRAFFFLILLGGFGAHRFYVGHWRMGLAYLGYTLGTVLFEVLVLEPHIDISLGAKADISLLTTAFLWFILACDLVRLRTLVNSANPPQPIQDVFS